MRNRLTGRMEPFDFVSRGRDVGVESFPLSATVQPRSRCGGSQADGVWDGTCSLSMPFVQNVWRRRPCLLAPRRGLAVAVIVRSCVTGTRSAVPVEGDRAVFRDYADRDLNSP